MKKTKVVEKLQFGKLGSVHFWYKRDPKKLRILQEKVQRFHEVQGYRLLRYSSRESLVTS